jgi:hypothetical protein
MKYVIKAEEALLKQTGKLTSHPHIFCVKCEVKTTAFGSNLQNKISKAGGLGELLSTFECRDCRTAGQNKQRLPKTPRKKRGAKGAAKEARTQDMLKNLPSMVFSERKPVVLVSNPEYAAEVTSVACVRPDIFLDSNRSCDFCQLYNVCKASCRRLSSQGWQYKAVAA